ncbi:MAG TPA: acyl-CoA dehydratase activase-related protein, partial [bacterium]|nr:acyl-CoA dehydratase activase-related protein [bacterium]
KSDLIHRQQEGFTIPEMWSGLCKGMVHTAITTLFRGRKPAGPVLLAGGVALNREVVKWLKDEIEAELVVPPEPQTFSSRGATFAAKAVRGEVSWSSLLETRAEGDVSRRPELALSLSSYPSFGCMKSYVDDATEVRLHRKLSGDVVIGIDIGSTSTKAAILGMDGEVSADLYRRTSGDPIGATQKILAAISRATEGELTVRGVATTGSGRKMVGAIIGADLVINEITAHSRGAAASDPDVETILEIGGQDAKYVAMREGVPHDSNMNYVCAAGTGSFVEEQAGKLGFALTEVGDAVMGTCPPFSSDRCTVFMEQDVHALIRAGFDRREVMGSVLYSVVQNYLNRVVGRRPLSRRKICFMGATARNKGLVAAFEKLLGAPISVSPYCHVMGAYGVALSALDEVARAGAATKFRGLSFSDEKVELRRELCELCAMGCRITRAIVGEGADEASSPTWGYMCGRDPEEKRVRVNSNFNSFRKRERLWKAGLNQGAAAGETSAGKTVGIPRALLTHGNLPMWSKFFGELGAKIALSKPTDDETLAKAVDFIGSDYCYPVKLAHGHVRELALDPKVDFIFLPYLIQGEPHDDGFERNVYCPYNIAFASILKSSGAAEEKPILTAAINFQLDVDIIVSELARELTPALGVSSRRIEKAWLDSLAAQRSFEENCQALGREALSKMESEKGRGIVLLGRPYNVCDLGANLSLPSKIADMDLSVFTVDMLPLSGVKIDPLFHNMYWNYGRKILQAATLVAENPALHAVFLTNFGCGPDSFLQTYVEKIMKGKPMLMLELDEHSADAGYITRLEAFKDVIDRANAGGAKKRPVAARRVRSATRSDSRTLWIPPMHPYGTPLLSAALRSTGKDARPLPPETAETFEIAKRFCRGTECVPLPSTIGAFLRVLRDSKEPEKQCFFMPSAKGPCRFGQYHTLHRIILDEAG